MESTLKKGQSAFNLVGVAKVNDEYTFKLDQESQNSDWVYNVLKLGVECGSHGVIYSEMMGGYGAERDNVVYVHGSKENEAGNMVDDYENRYTIDWEDRFDEEILEEIGRGCFITVGLEKDSKEKTFTKKFLTEYDAIQYISEHLEDGMVVNVKGGLEYSDYDGSTQTKKKITSIYLSKQEDVEKHKATFTQTILVDKDSVQKVDKDKNVYPLEAYVVSYVGSPKIDGKKVEVKASLAFPKDFDVEIKDLEKTEKLVKKLFKPTTSKKLYEITVEGFITKGGSANVSMSVEDLPEDIKELIELDAFTEEEALEMCVGRQSSVESFLITNPKINRVGEERTPALAFDKDKYKANELITYGQAMAEVFGEEQDDDKVPFDEDGDIDMDALLEGIDE